MKRLKPILLIILWFVLAYQVGRIINAANENQKLFIGLAFLAWFGGLVTSELIHYISSWFLNRKGKR